uniref:Uncharacterized protein n=1 Tax=Onchocerca volvulus TaxID=6282 RepID=A0A8R1U2E2_ONCVO
MSIPNPLLIIDCGDGIDSSSEKLKDNSPVHPHRTVSMAYRSITLIFKQMHANEAQAEPLITVLPTNPSFRHNGEISKENESYQFQISRHFLDYFDSVASFLQLEECSSINEHG